MSLEVLNTNSMPSVVSNSNIFIRKVKMEGVMGGIKIEFDRFTRGRDQFEGFGFAGESEEFFVEKESKAAMSRFKELISSKKNLDFFTEQGEKINPTE